MCGRVDIIYLRRFDISSNPTKYPEGTTKRFPSSLGIVTDPAEMSSHWSVSWIATPFLAENVSRLLFQKLKQINMSEDISSLTKMRDSMKRNHLRSFTLNPTSKRWTSC